MLHMLCVLKYISFLVFVNDESRPEHLDEGATHMFFFCHRKVFQYYWRRPLHIGDAGALTLSFVSFCPLGPLTMSLVSSPPLGTPTMALISSWQLGALKISLVSFCPLGTLTMSLVSFCPFVFSGSFWSVLLFLFSLLCSTLQFFVGSYFFCFLLLCFVLLQN